MTFDLNFGDLLATGAHTFPSVIIFRLYNETPPSVDAHLQIVLAQRIRELEDGALVIVEDTRHRLRRLLQNLNYEAKPSMTITHKNIETDPGGQPVAAACGVAYDAEADSCM